MRSPFARLLASSVVPRGEVRILGNPTLSRGLVLETTHALHDNPAVGVAAELDLVGRERELARVPRFVDDLAQAPAGVVVSGEPGIGKTVLWDAALEAARSAGVMVLATRCVEAELPLGLAGLGDLVEGRLVDVTDELTEAQRSTLAVAIGLETPGASAETALALPRAFVAYLRALALNAPVLIAVDDAQWLDPPSLRLLAFAVRRLGESPIGVLTTQRGDGADALELERAIGSARCDRIHLEGLSLGALAHLVRDRLGVRVPRPVLARVHAVSGGNPMFALEFARVVAGGSPQLGPLPIPTSLQELVGARVAGLPRRLAPLLEAAAAAERPTPSLLRALDVKALEALDAAVDAGALIVDADGVVRFTHPLLTSAVYAEIPSSRRRALHARIAAASDDAEERARHLVLSAAEPDAGLASLLDQAAARARARGAPDAAAELAQEAVRLTPPEAVGDRHERALAVIGYLAEAARTPEASAYLDDVLSRQVTGAARARALLLRMTVDHDLDVIGPAAEEALDHVGDDLALRARALLVLSAYQLYREEIVASEQSAREALAAAEEVADPALLATALGVVADRADMAGRPEAALLERAIALADEHGVLAHWPSPRVRLGESLLRDGDLDVARTLLEAELAATLRRGDEYMRGRVVGDLVDLECRAGNWRLAEQHLDDVREIASDGGDLYAEAFCLLWRGRLAALRGRADESRRLLSEAVARGARMHWTYFAAVNRWQLGFLELSLAEPARAWDSLEDVPDALTRPSRRNFDVMPAVADATEALVALGRLEEGAELLRALREETRLGHRWAGLAALRCQALLLLARGDVAGALAAAEQAADGFEAMGCPVDRGRALLVTGVALRRAGERRRAAEKLEAARTVFSDLGAALWVERAEQELRRARPRPRRDRELTAAERRVAALVATGLKNREVAAQLFTTVATVEAHLTRIYRKTGVRSRTALAHGIAEGTIALEE